MRTPAGSKAPPTEHSRERQIPTLDEVAHLADTIAPRFRAMVLLAAFAGLRKGECLGLARRHLDLDGDPPTVTVERSIVQTNTQGMIVQDPKTDAGVRTLALPELLCDELRTHLDQYVGAGADALLFTSEHSGDTPTKVMWRTIWNQARTDADVACTFHDLRHVAGTLNATAGATIKEAMARLGHASPVAALRYQHAVASRDAEIAGERGQADPPTGLRSPQLELTDPVLVDPSLDLDGIEPDELADLHVRDAPLRHQPADEPHRHPEPLGSVADIEQPDRRLVRLDLRV